MEQDGPLRETWSQFKSRISSQDFVDVFVGKFLQIYRRVKNVNAICEQKYV